MRLLGRTLIQYNYCPDNYKKFGYRQVQREDDVKTQGEDSHLQAQERGFRGNDPATFWFGHLCPELWENKFYLHNSVYGTFLWHSEQSNTVINFNNFLYGSHYCVIFKKYVFHSKFMKIYSYTLFLTVFSFAFSYLY